MSPGSLAWTRLMDALGVRQADGRHVWQALCHAADAEAATLRYHLDQLGCAPSFQQANAVLDTLTPTRLLGLLEALVEDGRLPRRVVVQLEEKILEQLSRDGRWR